MADRQSHLEHMSVPSCPLRWVVLDQPIGGRVGRVESNEVVTALDTCPGVPREESFNLGRLSLPHATHRPDKRGALECAGAGADTPVFVSSDEDRLLWPALETADLCTTARESGANPFVLVELDEKRAIVGAMQWLQTGDAFCVIGPPPQALDQRIALRTAGRGTWDEPENGEFHDCPRDPKVLRPHVREATENR